MIDSHCHIDLAEFDRDRDIVIQDALALGLRRLLVPGLYPTQWQDLLSLKSQYESIDIAFGFHPYFLRKNETQDAQENAQILDAEVNNHRGEIVAIGETGLDTFIDTELKQQIEFLEIQIDIAAKYKLPLILHHRKSHHHLIQLLKQKQFGHGGSIHAFSGSKEIGSSYIDLGFKLGIGGTITYPRANKTIEAISQLGIRHLLLETDAPDMPINGFQGMRNTPQRLPLIASALAKLLKLDEFEVIQATSANYLDAFLSEGKLSTNSS